MYMKQIPMDSPVLWKVEIRDLLLRSYLVGGGKKQHGISNL